MSNLPQENFLKGDDEYSNQNPDKNENEINKEVLFGHY
jgi:hypothetical protein